MNYSGLPERLAHVRATIARHQALGGWSHPVEIVAVVKGHGPEAVRAAWKTGLGIVGENRVQEALAKMEAVSDVPVAWHLVGTLQRNKVRQVMGRFELIHSVDRAELVAELAKRAAATDTSQRVLLEVNCGGESNKAGVLPEGLPALLEETLRHQPRLQVEGLMTLAPFTDDRTVPRAAFRRLRLLRDDAESRGLRLPQLSMGMSNDYPIAVEEGATMVRLGTILFGERNA